MKKFYITTALSVLTVGVINAYPVNQALSLTQDGYVDCGQMPKLNNLSSFSLQFWINPAEWTENASILSRGDKFSVELGKSGSVVFNVDNSRLEASSDVLKPNEWNQITLICDNGSATALINGEEVSKGQLSKIPEESAEFYLGGSYAGLIDEVRVFDAALNDEMKTFDYFTNNTINKWNPMWENLLVYYKMDQVDCPYIVDYKLLEGGEASYDNHGMMSDKGVEKVVVQNDKLPYLVNAAYTENLRFFDRIIPRDQYLLSNEIIILGADCVGSTGKVVTRTPNNHATVKGGEYLASFEGREGVISFDGDSETMLIAPAATWNAGDKFGFETWIYLEEWTPGAYIFRKETEDGKNGISLRLGTDASTPTLIARINGNDFVSQDFNLKVGEWAHIGLAPGTGGSVIKALMFYLNDKSIRPNVSASTDNFDIEPVGNSDISINIGEGLKAKLDETAFWNKSISLSDATKHMTNMPMPSLTKNAVVEEISNCSAYYMYDNPDNLGHSYHSQDEWANIMRSAYDGYDPANISISVRGHDAASASDNFTSIINNADKRKIFAQDLAEISKNYDGVELDLEWIYGNSWNNYALLADEIVAALPEGKTFRISTHNVTYSYPKDKINDPGITGFTFQQYGPQESHFYYKVGFTDMITSFLNYGYPADKIMSSYSTTTSKGKNGADILGVRTILATYTPSDANIDTYTNGTDTWSYMGPMQVYRRAKYTREENLQGIFYWDMGNDYWEGTAANPVMPKYNSAKYCSYGLSSNIHPVVGSDLKVNHFGAAGIEGVEKEDVTKGISVYPSPAENEITVTLNGNTTPSEISIYSMSGQKVTEGKETNNLHVGHLSSGIYVLTASSNNGKRYKTKFIKR